MQIAHPLAYSDEEDVSLPELWQAVVRARLVIICAAVVFATAGGVMGLLVQPQYEAWVTMAATTDNPTASRMGTRDAAAVAALIGTATSASRMEESIATLQSDLLTEKYIRDNELLPILYADQWDAASKRWKKDDPEEIPTVWEATRYFKEKIREVSDSKRTQLTTLTIRWTDSQLAAKWANDLVRITNEYLREKAIRESQRNIEYLNEQASQTEVVEVREAIYELIEDEINKEMLATGRDEYALRVIDPAVAPEESSTLGPISLALIGFVLGSFGVTAFAAGRPIFRGSARREIQSSSAVAE